MLRVSDIVKDAGFKVFANVVKNGGLVKAINAKGCADFTRKQIDELTDFAAVYKAKGLAWIKIKEDLWQSPIVKFFTDEEKDALKNRLDLEPGDIVFFVADQPKITNEALGQLRNELARRLEMISDDTYEFVWVTHFPLLDYDETEKRYQALHHPFTSPLEEDIEKLDSDPVDHYIVGHERNHGHPKMRAERRRHCLDQCGGIGNTVCRDRSSYDPGHKEHRRTKNERLWTVIATCALQGRSAFNFILAAVKAHFHDEPAPSLLSGFT